MKGRLVKPNNLVIVLIGSSSSLLFMVTLMVSGCSANSASSGQEPPPEFLSAQTSANRALCSDYTNVVAQNHARADQWLNAYSQFSTTTFHQHQVFKSLAIHYGYQLIDIPADQYSEADSELKSALGQVQARVRELLDERSDTVSTSGLFDAFAYGQDELGAQCLAADLIHPQGSQSSANDASQGDGIGTASANRRTVCATHKLAVEYEETIARQVFSNVPRDEVFGWMTISAVQEDDLELALSNMVFDVAFEGPDPQLEDVVLQLYSSIRLLTERGGVIETARESGMWAAATMDILRVSSICKESGLPYPNGHRGVV